MLDRGDGSGPLCYGRMAKTCLQYPTEGTFILSF